MLSKALTTAAAGSAGGEYEISRSLRFNSADSAYLSRTPASAGDRQKWTFSCWTKIGALGTSRQLLSCGSAVSDQIFIGSPDTIYIYLDGAYRVITTAVFRDPSAWYHIVVSVDTTQGTPEYRTRVYVNGLEYTGTGTAITQNNNTKINDASAHDIGRYTASPSEYFNGYMADIHFIDGQALTPSSFGEFNAATGVWSPIKYAGAYGTNGFHLEFADNSDVTATTLGADSSGNGNNWTPSGSPGFSVTAGAGNDSLVDSPTRYGTDTGAGGEVRGNYCTLNPLAGSTTGTITYSNGNLDVKLDRTVANCWVVGSIAIPSSGKYYFEFTPTATNSGSTAQFYLGLSASNLPQSSSSPSTYRVYRLWDGQKDNGTASAYGNSFVLDDVCGVAVDMDNGKIWFSKNGTWQASGDPVAGTNAAFTDIASPAVPWYIFISAAGNNTNDGVTNFGQRPFAYTAPSGFKALVTTNLPDPTVVQGDDYFNTVLYDGTGSSQSITTVGFTPDFTWIKEKNAAADHALYDAVRGVTKQIESNTSTAETTEATGLTAFVTGGFTVGALAQVNTSGDNYVAWNWKANGAGSLNEVGSIPSTVSANTTAGISIVTYTGTGTAGTVGHGIGIAPRMVIVKSRDQIRSWIVQHASVGATAFLTLNTTDASQTYSGMWNDTAPTSTVFSLGADGAVNTNTEDYVAYCFAEVEGFSKVGSYTGNGSTDGPFVYTGFRPAFVLYKKSSSTGSWIIWDTKRSTFNVVDKYLLPSASNAEGILVALDILSNGFKLRTTNTGNNNSGDTYIYAAFAENPFKNALAR